MVLSAGIFNSPGVPVADAVKVLVPVNRDLLM